MLRTIKHKYLRPRLSGFTATSNAGAATASVGANEGTFASGGTGQVQLTVGDKYNRAPVVVGAIGDTVADGGYPALQADPTTTVLSLVSNGAAGSGDDGALSALALGWYHDEVGRVIPQRVLTTGHGARLIGLKVQGTGTAQILIGKADATLVDNGTGDYTLTFHRGFNRTPIVIPTLASDTAGSVKVESAGLSSVNIKTFNTSGVATDLNFYVAVLGWNSVVETPRLWRALKSPHLRPRMEAFHISVSAGTPTLTIGGTAGTITDNGAGDYSITYAEAFAREPIVLAIANNRVSVHTASSATACRLVTFAAGGTGAEATDVMAIVLGYDNADEFYQGNYEVV